MGRVLDDDSHLGELVADLVGSGEVAIRSGGDALVHQTLDRVIARRRRRRRWG